MVKQFLHGLHLILRTFQESPDFLFDQRLVRRIVDLQVEGRGFAFRTRQLIERCERNEFATALAMLHNAADSKLVGVHDGNFVAYFVSLVGAGEHVVDDYIERMLERSARKKNKWP